MTPASAWGARPPDFVALEQVAPTILQEIRYAGSFNFTGAPLPGYRRPRCLLLSTAAQRLAEVDARLAPFGLGLKVYDCYRPIRASVAMVRWARRQGPLNATEQYFLGPLTRTQVLQQKFVAPRSRHNRGTTVDLTLVARHDVPCALTEPPTAGAHCSAGAGALPMGTSHDCFAAQSATQSPRVPAAVRGLRALLVGEMQRAGFDNYVKEWWHFTLHMPPEPSVAYDFDID